MANDVLVDGVKLKELVATFNQEQTEDSLIAVLKYLKDSEVLIAFNPILNNLEDVSIFTDADEGEYIDPDQEFEAEYLLLEDGDQVVLPIFTDEESASDNEEYDLFGMHFLDILDIAQNLEVNGIVLNPYGEQFYLDKEGFDVFEDEALAE